MGRRPVVIAIIVCCGFLALLTAATVHDMFAVPAMPDSMKCVIDRNCPIVDYMPVAPLIAPRLSEIKPLPPSKPKAHDCDFSGSHPLRISSDWMWHGGILRQVQPVYPAKAKRDGVHGTVTVRVLINHEGEVEQACGDGHPLLRRAAEDAALQWLFRVPMLNGNPVPYVQASFVFKFVNDRPNDR